jgi:ribose/xylose/arabinose/galactoside ABC-type transport system permease subunit
LCQADRWQALDVLDKLVAAEAFGDGVLHELLSTPKDERTVVLPAVFGTGSALHSNFGTPRLFVNLLNDSAFVGVAAVGASFVSLSGGIDLSVGSIVALVGILIAKLIQIGCDPFLAMAIGVFLNLITF